MQSIPGLNGSPIALMRSAGDSQAVIKTLTAASQDVFAAGFSQDQVVKFWAEEDFSYSCAADPTAAVATSHRIPAYTLVPLVLQAGHNMAIIGTDSGLKFYLSY